MTTEIPADVLDELRTADEFEAACCELVDIATNALEAAKHDLAAATEKVDQANESYERAYRALDVAQAKLRTLRKTSGVVLGAEGYRPGTPAELAAIRGDYVAVLTLGGPNPGLAIAELPTGPTAGDVSAADRQAADLAQLADVCDCGHTANLHTGDDTECSEADECGCDQWEPTPEAKLRAIKLGEQLGLRPTGSAAMYEAGELL